MEAHWIIRLKTLEHLDRELPCHGKNEGLAYAESDPEWDYEMRQQFAYFLNHSQGKEIKVGDFHNEWQTSAIDFCRKALKKNPRNAAMKRTLHLFLDIQQKFERLVKKMETDGTLVIVK
jgi:N6-adenosine-specific RNA methylase IME4